MPAAHRHQILPLAVGGVAAAALGTIPLHRLPRPVQIGYVALPGVLTAVLSLAVQSQQASEQDRQAPAITQAALAPIESDSGPDEGMVVAPEPRRQSTPVFRLGTSLGLGALVAGAGIAGIWIDHRLERALRTQGVPMPRLVMGAATGALTVASVLLDREAPVERDTSES